MNLISFQEVIVTWGKESYVLRVRDERPYELSFKTLPVSILRKSRFWSQKLASCLQGKPVFFPEQGTEFQRSVWRAVAQIPWGEVRTYSEIAQMIGSPKAVRAVAQACAKNPLPLLIPCHRVVGKTDWGGFNGGVELKKKLLRLEGHRC